MPALAPARAAALARADAPRRELPVLGAKQKLDAAPAPAPKRGRRSGTLEDDWRNRASPSQIASDLAALCERGCRCGCAKKYFAGPENLTADATRTRALLKGYDQQQRREYLRTYLQNHRCREKGGSWKFSFSLDDASKPCCLSTFAARTGFRKDQIYKLQAELKAGIVADAVAGGNRRGGGDGDDVDTLQARQCFGYCKKLEQEAEPMPNSTQLQLDDISNGELYEEFRALELTAGTPEAQIASEDTLIALRFLLGGGDASDSSSERGRAGARRGRVAFLGGGAFFLGCAHSGGSFFSSVQIASFASAHVVKVPMSSAAYASFNWGFARR